MSSNVKKVDNTPNAGKLISALRDTGYDNLSSISDILDNAVDAEAKNVWIDIDPLGDDFVVSVSDDGYGMDFDTLDQAMKLGSLTERTIDSDLGKYGMGLVTASLSIGKRLTVITSDGNSHLTSIQDVDDIVEANSFEKTIGESSKEEIEIFKKLTRNADSGTVVLISKCDRMQNPNINQFSKQITKSLAQIFRIFLASNLNIFVRGDKVRAYDPLWLDKGAELFSDDMFEVKNGDETESIRVRIVALPKSSSSQEAELNGINQANQGFYLLRNNREVAAGEMLGLVAKHNRANRFRAEIYFSGNIDDQMGINFTKKRIRPQQQIMDKLKEITLPQFRSILRKFERDNPVSEDDSQEHDKSAKFINQKAKLLIKPKPEIEQRAPKTNAGIAHSKGDGNGKRNPLTSRESLAEKVNCRFELRKMDTGGNFFIADQIGKTTVITYNVDHPFYKSLISENLDRPEIIAALDYLTYSLASAQIIMTAKEHYDIFESYMSIFSSNLRTLAN